MYSVYFVVSEHSLSDRIRSVIDFPRFDLQYFGTEYHSALALRLAIVAKPQIIVLDSDAPFISVSKFVSMLRENDVNCVLILHEGSDARHEPCPASPPSGLTGTISPRSACRTHSATRLPWRTPARPSG